MSVDLTFYARTSASSSELVAEVERLFGADPIAQLILVGEAHVSPVRVEILQEGLSLTPSAGVQFRLNTHREVDAQMNLIVRATLSLSKRHPEHSALLYEGETIYFVCEGGALRINSQGDLWNFEHMAFIEGPFRRERFPVL